MNDFIFEFYESNIKFDGKLSENISPEIKNIINSDITIIE